MDDLDTVDVDDAAWVVVGDAGEDSDDCDDDAGDDDDDVDVWSILLSSGKMMSGRLLLNIWLTIDVYDFIASSLLRSPI